LSELHELVTNEKKEKSLNTLLPAAPTRDARGQKHQTRKQHRRRRRRRALPLALPQNSHQRRRQEREERDVVVAQEEADDIRSHISPFSSQSQNCFSSLSIIDAR
jgi:hypothetical protein